jgi:hypothetical protein
MPCDRYWARMIQNRGKPHLLNDPRQFETRTTLAENNLGPLNGRDCAFATVFASPVVVGPNAPAMERQSACGEN